MSRNTFNEEYLDQIEKNAIKRNFIIQERTDERITIQRNDSGDVMTYQLVTDWIERKAEDFPGYTFCLFKYEDVTNVEYSLKIRYGRYQIGLDYWKRKQENILSFSCYDINGINFFPHFNQIKESFMEWVEELPVYRLRLVTGELQKIDRTIL